MYATLTYYTVRLASYEEGAFFTLRAVDQVGPIQTLRDFDQLAREMRIFESFDTSRLLAPVDHVLQETASDRESYRVAVVSFAYDQSGDRKRVAYVQSIPSELLRFFTIGGYMFSPDLDDDDNGDDRESFEDVYLQVDTFEHAYRLATFARA